MGITLFADPIKTVYVPDDKCLEDCRALGENLAKKLRTEILED